MCVRISLSLHKTNQLAAGSHSRSLAGGMWWLSTRSGLPVAGDWRRRLRAPDESPGAAGSELPPKYGFPGATPGSAGQSPIGQGEQGERPRGGV